MALGSREHVGEGKGARRNPLTPDREVEDGEVAAVGEPTFSERSDGFRPGRSQHQAIEAARAIVANGKPYGVDLDLAQFFDRIHQSVFQLSHRHAQGKRNILNLMAVGLAPKKIENTGGRHHSRQAKSDQRYWLAVNAVFYQSLIQLSNNSSDVGFPLFFSSK